MLHTPVNIFSDSATDDWANADTDAHCANHDSLEGWHFLRRTIYPMIARAPWRSPAKPTPSSTQPKTRTADDGLAAETANPTFQHVSLRSLRILREANLPGSALYTVCKRTGTVLMMHRAWSCDKASTRPADAAMRPTGCQRWPFAAKIRTIHRPRGRQNTAAL